MPSYKRRAYQVGDYWLAQRGESPAWYRCWNDNGRTKRASIGTTCFEEAKLALLEWVQDNKRPQQQDDVPIAELIRRYWVDHGQHLRSSPQTNYSCQRWLDYWGDKMLSDLSKGAEQDAFRAWLADKGLSKGTLQRVLSDGRAAINRAYKRGEIKHAPHVHVPTAKGEPRGRPMTVDELQKLYHASEPHLQRFILIMLGTGCRPEAALDVHRKQVADGLIDLNPPGREQTKKVRPIVRCPKTLDEHLPQGYAVVFRGKRPKTIKRAWQRARERAGLDEKVKPYSLRHTVARWLRRHGVDGWQISTQLGHQAADVSSITELYTAHDPMYLRDAEQALDQLLQQVIAPITRQ